MTNPLDPEAVARTRANYLPAPHVFLLSQACQVVTAAFGRPPFLVGSSLKRREYRDVDVRLMLDDDEYDRIFGTVKPGQLNALWSLMCSSISLYLSQASDLPVDFQIQRSSDANAKYDGERQALGVFFEARHE